MFASGTRELALLPFPPPLPHHTHHAVTPPPRMNADGHAPAASSHITTLVAPAGQAHLPHLLSPVQDNIVALPNPPTHHTILQVEILFLRKMLKKLESITNRGGLLGSILANAFSENAFPCRHRGLQPPPVCCFGTHMHPRLTVRIRDDGSVCSLPFFQNAVFFKKSCQNKPETLWTDRGKGFYQPSNGCITGGFKQALREHKFKAIHGDDASAQPGRLQEVMLHETAVSWMRHRLARSVPAKPWEETTEQYSSRLKQVVAEINETLDVEGLCRALPKRIEDLVATRGDRLSY